MYCHNLVGMGSNPGQVELGVHRSLLLPKSYLNHNYKDLTWVWERTVSGIVLHDSVGSMWQDCLVTDCLISVWRYQDRPMTQVSNAENQYIWNDETDDMKLSIEKALKELFANINPVLTTCRIIGWMDERCFRPLLCTVKAELGRGQPGLMRWIWDETLPQSSIDRSTFYSAAHRATKWARAAPV